MKDGYSVVADISTEYLVTDRTQQYFLELYKDDFQVRADKKLQPTSCKELVFDSFKAPSSTGCAISSRTYVLLSLI